jgi:chaperonin GroES
MAKDKLLEFYEADNIAKLLSEDELQKIGQRAHSDYLLDEESRDEWLKGMEDAIKIAKQVMESKTFPWPNAANVKFPLITSAIISFSSRTYPEIVRGTKVVNAGIIGPDDGKKAAIAARISDHMSYQLLVESRNWEDDTDKLLMLLPLLGLVYRKTYWDSFSQIPTTDLCLPDKVCVNHNIKNLDSARRITHCIDLYKNDIIERINAGLFIEFDLEKLIGETPDGQDGLDDDKAYTFCEQHRYLDLDGDGYSEPYIVTFAKETYQVVRIVARYDLENILYSEDGKLIKINAVNYFTDYHFIPNPDGGFHSIGYGTLLYPINETINTTINQLLDAGTLSNRQSGFIGNNLRNKKGSLDFKPGEWKFVEAADGNDISKSIVPLPVKDPSPVLFQLLNLMIGAGKDLASVTDILQGQQQSQNSPATTVLALIEQGLKVHTAIIKRLHRSLKKEFEKLVRLNRMYLDDEMYFYAFDGEHYISREDYQRDNLQVFPVSDPNLSSDVKRMTIAQQLMQFKDDPIISKEEIYIRYFEALQIPNPKALIKPPDPNAPPPPDVLKTLAEIEEIKAGIADIAMKRELEALALEVRDNDAKARAAEAAARVVDMKLRNITALAKIEQEGQHFAIEKAIEDVNKEDDTEKLPEEQQIDYEKLDLAPLIATLQELQQKAIPNQAPTQEAPPPVGG